MGNSSKNHGVGFYNLLDYPRGCLNGMYENGVFFF